MQKVSNEYRDSMNQALRERGHMRITIGLVNQTAQKNIHISGSPLLSISSTDSLAEDTSRPHYAVLEDDFISADGGMRFLPRNISQANNDGVVSQNYISQGEFTLKVDFSSENLEIKGFTIDFGTNPPLDFQIIFKSKAITVTDNTTEVWSTDELFISNDVTIKVTRMANANNRVRIKTILFGYNLVFTNEEIISSTLTNSLSPISDELPMSDFNVTVSNLAGTFNTDEPSSPINYFSNDQEVKIEYGYSLPSGGIEWIKGGVLNCSSWEANEKTAQFTAIDTLRNKTEKYIKGKYEQSPQRNLYKVAEEIFEESNIKDYYIDESLKTFNTWKAIPIMPLREVFQIIANGTNTILRTGRNGAIEFVSREIPEYIITNTAGQTLGTNETVNIFDQANELVLSVNANGSEVSMKISFKSAVPCFGVSFEYAGTDVSQVLIASRDYTGSTSLTSATTHDRIVTLSSILGETTELEIKFSGITDIKSNLSVKNLKILTMPDMILDKSVITSPISASRGREVKAIKLQWEFWTQSLTAIEVINETIVANTGQEFIYYFDKPSWGYTVRFNDSVDLVQVLDSSAWFVKFKAVSSGTYNLKIQNNYIAMFPQSTEAKVSSKGATIEWRNPAIEWQDKADKVLAKMVKYYLAPDEYSFDYRGNPEIECGDILLQESANGSLKKVMVTKHTLKFDTSFSGSMVTRRVE